MKDNIELLNHLIDKEIESIESMLHLNKEDELTILRLQDKLRVIERNIEEHKQLIKEYRSHLRDMSESNHTRAKLNPSEKGHLDMGSSTSRIKSVGRLEK